MAQVTTMAQCRTPLRVDPCGGSKTVSKQPPRRESAWIREVCIAWMIPDVCEFLWQMMYCLALLCYLCLDLCATVEDDFVDVFLLSHQPFINSLQCPNISSGRFPNFKQGWKHQFTNWGISIPENPESRRYQIY
jgi:hypothetical protein